MFFLSSVDTPQIGLITVEIGWECLIAPRWVKRSVEWECQGTKIC